MSERIETNGNGMVNQGNNTADASGVDTPQRRRQNQPEGAHHIRQIFQGNPPRGFRIRQLHPNMVNSINSNVDTSSFTTSSNGNVPQHAPTNGNANGNSNGINDSNIPRIRVDLNTNAPENSPLNDTANGNLNTNRPANGPRIRVNLNRNNLPQRFPVDGNGNGNPNNASRNENVRRLRVNMGGRGPFVLRQQRQGQNPVIQLSRQQQRQPQSQQDQRSQRQSSLLQALGSNGSFNLGPNSNVQVRIVQAQVDPLAPQPVASSINTNTSAQATRQTNGNGNPKAEDPEDYEKFKCAICYEYLNDPVGCGKCASRFCRGCLQRVYDSDKQKQQPAKCPMCRCEYNEMVPDLELYKANETPALPCRFVCVGCTERKIPLNEIASHEQVCDHVPVRCRYANYGCQWIGKRGLVGAHEEFGCKLAPMGKFVEDYRKTKADHNVRLEMVAQQAAGSLRMSHVLRQTYTRDNQRKSLSDSLRLVQYCHAVTGLTPHFLMTKDLWVSYWRNNESRAGVVNFCICVPFLAAALGVVGRSMTGFFELFEDSSSDRSLHILTRVLDANLANSTTSHEKVAKLIQKIQYSEAEELLITSFLGFCVGALAILVVILSYIDTKSNINWDKISLPYYGGSFPLVGDAVAISIFTLLLAIMEYHQSGVRAFVLWATIVVSSTFFPALIFSISHYTARLVTRTQRPASFNMMEMARLVEPCMFGLRFSMMLSYFGVPGTLDASVVLSLMPRTSRFYLKNALFDHMPKIACHVFLTAKSAIWIYKVQNLIMDGDVDLSIFESSADIVESAQKFFTSSEDSKLLSELFDKISTSILATASLMVTSCLINILFALGNTVGDYIALTSQEELSPEGIARGTAKEYSSVGLMAFGGWVMMIALLTRI